MSDVLPEETGPLDEPIKRDGDSKISDPAKFIEWAIEKVGKARICHALLVLYASDFRMLEGRKRFIFCIFLVVAYFIDILVALILLGMIFSLLTGITISILRGLNVIPEVLSVFSHIATFISNLF